MDLTLKIWRQKKETEKERKKEEGTGATMTKCGRSMKKLVEQSQ